MLHLIFHLIMIERDHLIEVDLLAARQSANFAAFFHSLETGQNSGAELRVLCKRRLLVHRVAKAQPGIVGNGQAGQYFQEANRPVPPLIFRDSSSSFQSGGRAMASSARSSLYSASSSGTFIR